MLSFPPAELGHAHVSGLDVEYKKEEEEEEKTSCFRERECINSFFPGLIRRGTRVS
jgi:hypothetical protein